MLLCVFRQTFKQALVAFLFVFVFFLSMKLHFWYSKKGIKTICFGRRSILREKKSELASNFKLTRTPTIYGEHGIIAHIP